MRLRQILNNLAANAAKFTAEGSIALAARKGRDWVAFQVRDTGCGIPADKHDAIFAPFEQLQPGEDGAHGMGLGLAIVKQLVDLLGGTITVESSPGAGATFTVTLPTPIASGIGADGRNATADEPPRGRFASRPAPLRAARA
jgi:signal transduction histidine kinase